MVSSKFIQNIFSKRRSYLGFIPYILTKNAREEAELCYLVPKVDCLREINHFLKLKLNSQLEFKQSKPRWEVSLILCIIP